MVGPLKAGRPRGHSLLEAILASFLLVFAFFLVSRLFHTGLQYSRRVDERIAGVQFAEKRMAEIRRWAKGTVDWSSPPSTATDPQFPGYTASLSLRDETLFSPSTQLELAYPEDDRRAMRSIAKRAIVTISKPGLPPYVLSAVITRGDRGWPTTADVRISPSSATLDGPDEEVILTVEVYDEDGNEDKNLFFHWEIEPDFSRPNQTTAEVRLLTRDGRKAVVRNRTRRRSGVWVATNGSCQAVAFVRYKGNHRRGSTEDQAVCKLTLVAPP